MFRSSARLDHAFPLALLSLSLAAGATNAGEIFSGPRVELSWPAPDCQANTAGNAAVNATAPATEEATDDDFFAWIKKMTKPTNNVDGQKNPAAATRPTRPGSDRGSHSDKDHGGGGGGQGH
ncbi:MAG TPA: hypothetical protein VFE34_09385 [Dongiaceae bacterium]|jgi:hypothetical protein|nr:hypothetical protein [Dongiaceae bacterium]